MEKSFERQLYDELCELEKLNKKVKEFLDNNEKSKEMENINLKDENQSTIDTNKSYSVIGKWTELDGTENWDVIHDGPLTYEDALKISIDAGITWNKSVTGENKKIPHHESVITYDKLPPSDDDV